MEDDGIIASMDKPTDWVHNLVITQKRSGDLRICLDLRPLNDSVKRKIDRITTPDQAQAKLNGATIFTVIDEANSF